MKEKIGWNLWELDHHHGEEWEDRFQITLKNPTNLDIAETPKGWAVFRDGIKPMWEDKQNCGRLTAKNFGYREMYKIVPAFFDLLAENEHVCGILYTRTNDLALWLNTFDENTLKEVKKTFSRVCRRPEYEINWDNFEKSKMDNLHKVGIIWKYGQLSDETKNLTPLSVYKMDILKASPNFIINYRKVFPIESVECFLIETTFPNPFDSFLSIRKFVDHCFSWFQNRKSKKIIRIAKAIALKIVDNNITVRFYTDPVGYCNKTNVIYENIFEVLILFAQKWKENLLDNYLSPEIDLKINGMKEEDRVIQLTV